MATRTSAPLLGSKAALRALVTGITLTTFTGMSAFAAGHLQNASAPLRPAADGASVALATPAAAPTARTRGTNTGRVPTSNAAPLTRTHSS